MRSFIQNKQSRHMFCCNICLKIHKTKLIKKMIKFNYRKHIYKYIRKKYLIWNNNQHKFTTLKYVKIILKLKNK